MHGTSFVAVCSFLSLLGPSCSNSDNLALLAKTLKTMQRAACDDEMVALACPRGTTISIQVAQYGKATADGHMCADDNQLADVVGDRKCLWPNSMQYSLLQTVVEACQKKPQCKFSSKPKQGLVDPCPLTRKFVEVAYKCRPYEFRSRSGCEDEVVKLSCNPHSRVAIFDAQYGRTAYESITCPQTQGELDETCKTPYAVKTVMDICHGKRRCQITVNSQTFGSPCKSRTKNYLKVVYACVPLGVLIEKYETAAETDETLNGKSKVDQDELFDDSDGAGEKWGEPNGIAPVADPALQPQLEDIETASTSTESPRDVSISLSNNKSDSHTSYTNFYIFVSIGILVFILVIAAAITIRCYFIKKSAEHSKNGEMFTAESPNVFNDAASDIENDVDVSRISGTFYEHPDMILYNDVPGSKGTIRAMRPLSTIYPCAGTSMYGVDYVQREPHRFSTGKEIEPEVMMSPKSLGNIQNTQFYYN